MAEERESLLQEIESHREAIESLNDRIRDMERAAKAKEPEEFYFVYHVVAGMMIGVMGALISFVVNVVGSMLVHQDPVRLLRVFGTFFVGERALVTSDLNFLMLVLMAHFCVGAVAGALFHVVVNKHYAAKSYEWKVLAGGIYGMVMWIAIFYLMISWVQPMMVGEAFILSMIPVWVAALTHIVFGLSIGVMEPMGRFSPYRTG